MSFEFAIALAVFVGSLILFLFERIDKTLVALWSVLILVLAGVLTPIEAAKGIDLEIMLFFFWLMLVVWIATASGFFSYLNMFLANKSWWDAKKIFLLLIIMITLVSTIFPNNATLVLLIVPIAIAIARGLSLDAKLLVILLAIFSNIWGTLTLIWDPPNTLIWVQAGLSFMSFIENLWIPISVMIVVILAYVMYVYRNSFPEVKGNLTQVFTNTMIIKRISYKYSENKMNKYVTGVTIFFILLTVVLLILQPKISEFTWIHHGMIAFMWIAIWVTASIFVGKKVTFHRILKEVEWDSLLFLSALFIQVAALQKVWFLEIITEQILKFSDNLPLLIVVIVWWIGLASTLINTIPFVAMMIPIIMEVQQKMAGMEHVDLLWRALALWACLWGNGTIIASASWVIAVDLAKKQWINISFMDFFKVGMPITIISLFISSVYLLWVYYFG